MKHAFSVVIGCAMFTLTGCAADRLNLAFDPSLLSPTLYCPDDAALDVTHLKLVDWSASDVAVVRPRSQPSAPGRQIRKWRTAVIAGHFDVMLVPGDGGTAGMLAVHARVACGPRKGLEAEARGEWVRVRLMNGPLDVSGARGR